MLSTLRAAIVSSNRPRPDWSTTVQPCTVCGGLIDADEEHCVITADALVYHDPNSRVASECCRAEREKKANGKALAARLV